MEEKGDLSKVWGLPTPTHSEMEKKKEENYRNTEGVGGSADGQMEKRKKEERVGGRGR